MTRPPRKVHLADPVVFISGSYHKPAACSVVAYPLELTIDPNLVTCHRCQRTGAYKRAVARRQPGAKR